MSTLRLGTRMSMLALAQAGQVAAEVERVTGRPVVRVGIETEGDRLVDRPLASNTGPMAKGWFTAAIEDAIRAGRVEFAVHSLKDLPVAETPGLTLIIPKRADPADVLLLGAVEQGAGLPVDAARIAGQIGASSPRRLALLKRWLPQTAGAFLRGNVTTRITRLREGKYDGILLAASGLGRLAEGSAWAAANPALAEARAAGVRVLRVDTRLWPGAPGQGALALQVRSDDTATLDLLAPLEHAATRRAITLEREALAALGTGCAVPFGACVTGDAADSATFAVEVDGQMIVGECAATELASIVTNPDAIRAHALTGELTFEEMT